MVTHAQGNTRRGCLFSQGFLDRELKHIQPWQALDNRQLETIRSALEATISGISTEHLSNEADTKHRVIRPVLRCLGWREGQALVVLKTTTWQANPEQGHGQRPAPAASMVAALGRGRQPR